jgi:hypothetical protein
VVDTDQVVDIDPVVDIDLVVDIEKGVGIAMVVLEVVIALPMKAADLLLGLLMLW